MILSWWGLTSALTKNWRLHWATRSPSWPEEPPEETQWATRSTGSWLLAEVTLFLHFRVCTSFLVTDPGDQSEEACGSPSTIWGATCGAFPGTRRTLRAVPGRGRGFYNRLLSSPGGKEGMRWQEVRGTVKNRPGVGSPKMGEERNSCQDHRKREGVSSFAWIWTSARTFICYRVRV